MKLKLVGIEEGKEFRFKEGIDTIYRLEEGNLMIKSGGEWLYSCMNIGIITNSEIEPVITLTEEEIIILKSRQLEGYNWIGKNYKDDVFVYEEKPKLEHGVWEDGVNHNFIQHDMPFIDPQKIYNIEDVLKNV